MYRTEVPLYGDLVEIVRSVDDAVLLARDDGGGTVSNVQEPQQQQLPARHRLERHGAIRLGTQHEMRTIGRLFAIMGMHPVGYYDLAVPGVGFPLHGTAFRPLTEDALRKNPFRVFTTVLRPDLITSSEVRETATAILQSRNLFSPALYTLLDRAELAAAGTDALTAEEAETFIAESLKIFQWHSRSRVPLEVYLRLKREHPIVADIVCFPSAHINHLTPRTLDIDAVQAEMIRRGLPAKECIEGPPAGRKCEILLRQTSFKALEERVVFPGEGDSEANRAVVDGTHTARFGEVEQRGAAVTRRGRDLYDGLLAQAMEAGHQSAGTTGSGVLEEVFRAHFPDDWTELRKQGLVFFRYRVRQQSGVSKSDWSMEELLEKGIVECEPITYEDFLPFSAAGIFRSNLGDGRESPDGGSGSDTRSNDGSDVGRKELEALLGRTIPSEIDMYERLQSASVRECEEVLGLEENRIALWQREI